MSSHRPQGLTDGYLPEAAFLHVEPTAVGYLDIERPLEVRHAAPPTRQTSYRDALVMVRLHEQPLAIVHLAEPLDATGSEALAASIWRQVGEEARAHCARFACVAPPTASRDLVAGLGDRAGGCHGAQAANAGASVTVVIPTGGRPHALERCLRSLCGLRFGSFEVVVVDNQPHVPGTRAVVAAFADALRARYVAEPRPGSSVARNRGLAEAATEFVAFADDDVVVDAGWLRWMMHPFAEPEVGAVTGMILPLALDSEAQKRLEQYAGFSKGVVGRRYDLGANRADDRVLYPYWGGMFGSGASMAFRTADLAAAGGLDPALGAGSPARSGADIEVLTAAILRGGQVAYEPRAVCWHEHTRDPAALRRQLFNYGAGFAAIMTKYLTGDPRFLGACARSVPLALDRRRTRDAAPRTLLPRELARAEHRGMLCGPWLYARSRRWARRLKLADVVRGR
jgi:cellulose synthase/poly-beta-1,6-N-acetylglucosamine synthase-like glycosyltransferase